MTETTAQKQQAPKRKVRKLYIFNELDSIRILRTFYIDYFRLVVDVCESVSLWLKGESFIFFQLFT